MMDQTTVNRLIKMERRLDSQRVPERSSDLISPYLALPGLRGFWPMSAFSSNGGAYDLSGNGRTLTYNGNPAFGYDVLAPYCAYDGTGDYHERADEAGLDITGTETYVTDKGLTLGGWFNPTAMTTASIQGLMGKFSGGANQRSYLLRISSALGTVHFTVNGTGLSVDNVNVLSAVMLSIGTWYFIVGRFDPGVESAIFVSGVKSTLAVGIPASLFIGTSDFDIGGAGGGANLCATKAALCFLCAAYLDDTIISSLFQQTRAAFAV